MYENILYLIWKKYQSNRAQLLLYIEPQSVKVIIFNAIDNVKGYFRIKAFPWKAFVYQNIRAWKVMSRITSRDNSVRYT